MKPRSPWLSKPWLWAVPLLFLLVNLGVFIFYRVAYAGQVELLQGSFAQQESTLAKLTAFREEMSADLDRVRDSRNGIAELYLQHFDTEADRFTAMRSEIIRLAKDAGLDPSNYSYPASTLEELELRQRGVNFTVEGSYSQLRTFLNLLEVTDHFMILESVTLNASGGAVGGRDPKLSIKLAMETIFSSDALARRTAAAEARRAAQQVAPAAAGDGERDADDGSAVSMVGDAERTTANESPEAPVQATPEESR